MSREWYERSKEFMEEANLALSRNRFWFACFNAHQAVEFALKGKLIEICGTFTFTHDLTLLCKDLSSCKGGEVPEDVLLAAQFLSPHYTSSRYPGTRAVNYDLYLAENCIKMAEKVIEWVKKG